MEGSSIAVEGVGVESSVLTPSASSPVASPVKSNARSRVGLSTEFYKDLIVTRMEMKRDGVSPVFLCVLLHSAASSSL